MTLHSEKRTAGHLMNVINTRNGKVPNFSLLLGSGASRTSGIKTAEDMIAEWRALLSDDSDDVDRANHATRKSLADSEDEYSVLFETIYDQPLQRRNYIEECVKDAFPGWGYMYLTSLLTDRILM